MKSRIEAARITLPANGHAERIACCVGSRSVQQTVVTTLRRCNYEAIEISASSLFSALQREHACALLDDLYPWDETGVARIQLVRREYPDLPILLYPPARPGIAELLTACTRIPGVHAELQQLPGTRDPDRLRFMMKKVLEEGPRIRLLRMLRTIIQNAPSRMWAFSELALSSIGHQQTTHCLTVSKLAFQLGFSPRTLERSWCNEAIPGPKEMLEWLALLLAALLAAQSGVTVARAARTLGMDSQQLYRIRQRLLPTKCDAARASFDAIFLAFADRCNRTTKLTVTNSSTSKRPYHHLESIELTWGSNQREPRRACSAE